uniref:HMG box domain-containing protein n=1 Tax=Hyaloperonospora arabidopsidis (strain Emoy2) TaxID=559515 RepID=M4B3K7_HYAAE
MEMFAFDYYLRSRTAAEIGRRCDSLMRICEKDNADLETRERKEQDVRHVLQEQRAKLDKQLSAARADVKQHQAHVDELIMKEAKRMQKQRENKRAKKRKERDQNEDMVDQYTEALVSFLVQATNMDAAKVALDFCAKIRQERNEELQPSYVLKKIRQVAEPDKGAAKGALAWTIKGDFANVKKSTPKREKKVLKQAHMADISCDTAVKSEHEDKGRLPRSPWSPTAMKQKVKQEKKVKKEGSALSSVRKPRSAYVLFSIASRVEVKQSLGNNASLVDAMRKISQTWKDMSPEQKSPWIEAAKQDQVRYENEMNETVAKTSKLSLHVVTEESHYELAHGEMKLNRNSRTPVVRQRKAQGGRITNVAHKPPGRHATKGWTYFDS